MALEIPVRSGWQGHVVATRSHRGQVYVLLSVRKTTCDICRYGVRFDTRWGSASGEVQRIEWCTSCFNAESGVTDTDEQLEFRRQRLVQRASSSPPEQCWTSARPAIEDLERRGLV
jgi:hypothetical protein